MTHFCQSILLLAAVVEWWSGQAAQCLQPSWERNQKLLCARCLTGTAWRDLVILLSPLLPQRFLFCLGVVSVFVYVWVFTEQKILFFVLFLIQGLYQEWRPRPLCHFSVYIVKFSKFVRQGVRGKSKFIIVIMKR